MPDGERPMQPINGTRPQGKSRQIDFAFDGDLLPEDRYTIRAEAYNR